MPNDLETVEMTPEQTGAKEQTSNTANDQLAGAINGFIDVDVSAGNVILTNAQVLYKALLTIVGATVAGRTVTWPQKQRLAYVLSDPTNTQTVALVRGTTSINLDVGSSYMVVSDGSANGLVAYALGGSGGGGGGGPDLTANTTFYVRSDGNDANNGLADTAGGAWLTIQKAIDSVLLMDLGGFTATIQVRDGTYAPFVMTRPVTNGYLTLVGNVATPANVIIQTAGAILINISNGAILEIAGGFKLQQSSGNGQLLQARDSACITITGAMEYGSAGTSNHITATRNATIQLNASYTISGGAGRHLNATLGSQLLLGAGITVTLVGTPAFTIAYAVCNNNSLISALTTTYVGSATGIRYEVANNANIGTNQSEANFETHFPGSLPGTKESGGRASSAAPPATEGLHIITVTASATIDNSYPGRHIQASHATGLNITVPTNATLAIPIGSRIWIEQTAAGQITIVPAGGVTVQTKTSLKSGFQYGIMVLIKTASNVWKLSGDTETVDAIMVAMSDETTAITVGTGKVTFRMPYAGTLYAVSTNLNTASSSGLPTVDIKKNGVTVLSTLISIDVSEKTSLTAATAAVISVPAFAKDDEVTMDVTVAGTGAKGLKTTMHFYRYGA